ncbi:MAG: GNAT family N-acetyltransferase [Pseudomonadota bacterium]
MATFHIRPAVLEDEAEVSALLLRSYSVLLTGAYDGETLRKALPLIASARPELLTSGTYYVAETDNGKMIGVGGWTRTSPTGRNETANNGNIRHFGTDPDHIGEGVGRALMDRCVAEAASAGLSELNCYSTLNGEGFYRACGFESIEPFEIELPENCLFPSIRMTRPL